MVNPDELAHSDSASDNERALRKRRESRMKTSRRGGSLDISMKKLFKKPRTLTRASSADTSESVLPKPKRVLQKTRQEDVQHGAYDADFDRFQLDKEEKMPLALSRGRI